jgi:hypothetical protein
VVVRCDAKDLNTHAKPKRDVREHFLLRKENFDQAGCGVRFTLAGRWGSCTRPMAHTSTKLNSADSLVLSKCTLAASGMARNDCSLGGLRPAVGCNVGDPPSGPRGLARAPMRRPALLRVLLAGATVFACREIRHLPSFCDRRATIAASTLFRSAFPRGSYARPPSFHAH